MNLNMFDDMSGIILRERENTLGSQNINRQNSGENRSELSRFPQNTPLAMAYVPFQQWGDVYSADEAFGKGTLFSDLDFPFERGGNSHE